RRHTSFARDWSSDVCSSDLANHAGYVALFRVTRLAEGEQKAIAETLRVVADSARRVDHPGPILGILVPESPSPELERAVRSLSGDRQRVVKGTSAALRVSIL